MRLATAALLTILGLPSPAGAAAERPVVAVSVAPLGWVVERLAADQAEVVVLLPPGADVESHVGRANVRGERDDEQRHGSEWCEELPSPPRKRAASRIGVDRATHARRQMLPEQRRRLGHGRLLRITEDCGQLANLTLTGLACGQMRLALRHRQALNRVD